MSCGIEVTNESTRCWERNFQPYNIMLIDQAWGQDGWISGTIFAFLWTEKLRSIERQKRTSQISSIDYEQSLSFSDLVRGVHAIASGEAARRDKRGRQTEEKKERLPTWPEQIKYYWSIKDLQFGQKQASSCEITAGYPAQATEVGAILPTRVANQNTGFSCTRLLRNLAIK